MYNHQAKVKSREQGSCVDASSTGSRRSESGQGGGQVGSEFGLEGGQESCRKKRKSKLQAGGMQEALCGDAMGTAWLQPYRTQQRFPRKGGYVCDCGGGRGPLVPG